MQISIVVPSFNQARYLDAALRSLVEQRYPEKEIIVMDGGSTDGSVEVIHKYEEHLATWRSEPDGGQSNALKAGFEIANGQVISWLNSDDVLAPGALERVAREVRRAGSPDGVFYGGWEVIDAESTVQELFSGFRMTHWIAQTIGPPICQPGTFFGRDVYRQVGGVDCSLRYAMDLDLWMRFVVAGVKFFSIPSVQAQFRSHPMQKGHSLEWLKDCVAEEQLIQSRYNLAPAGSSRRLFALQAQRVLRLATGRLDKTWAFRIFRRSRLRSFAVSFSK